MKQLIKLSVIIPVFNEEKEIAKTLNEVTNFLKTKDYSWEVIVVDDGSWDKTVEIVKGLNLPNVKVVGLASNEGKGAAIRSGVELALGENIIFTDADLSVPLNFTDDVLGELDRGANVVIGSRRAIGAKIIKHQPFLRETMGRIFTLLSIVIVGTWISDFTCGFKGFKARAAKKVFAKSRIDRWVFDSEILFLARKFGYKIVEVPVSWINREDSRIRSLGGAGIKSFWELMQIPINNLSGKYD